MVEIPPWNSKVNLGKDENRMHHLGNCHFCQQPADRVKMAAFMDEVGQMSAIWANYRPEGSRFPCWKCYGTFCLACLGMSYCTSNEMHWRYPPVDFLGPIDCEGTHSFCGRAPKPTMIKANQLSIICRR